MNMRRNVKPSLFSMIEYDCIKKTYLRVQVYTHKVYWFVQNFIHKFGRNFVASTHGDTRMQVLQLRSIGA